MEVAEVIAYLESHRLAEGGELRLPSTVRAEELIPICDDYLEGRILELDLQRIAGALLQHPAHNASRQDFDPELDYDFRVERALVEWWAPEIQVPLSRENVLLIRNYLGGSDWQPMQSFTITSPKKL